MFAKVLAVLMGEERRNFMETIGFLTANESRLRRRGTELTPVKFLQVLVIEVIEVKHQRLLTFYDQDETQTS